MALVVALTPILVLVLALVTTPGADLDLVLAVAPALMVAVVLVPVVLLGMVPELISTLTSMLTSVSARKKRHKSDQ